jgi:hypothetical protein
LAPVRQVANGATLSPLTATVITVVTATDGMCLNQELEAGETVAAVVAALAEAAEATLAAPAVVSAEMLGARLQVVAEAALT